MNKILVIRLLLYIACIFLILENYLSNQWWNQLVPIVFLYILIFKWNCLWKK